MAAVIANRKIVKVVKIKKRGGVEYFISRKYRRIGINWARAGTRNYFFNSRVMEFMQYLRCLVGGPSLKT